MIDVVVPVYAGFNETTRCIESVLASRSVMHQSFDLIVIDDCGGDQDIGRFLEGLQGREGVTILKNALNRGFVASANRGLSFHADRDVVLLNSDTEVAGDWLDRLHACAYRSDDIGTVTPFSNNATICSFPVFCADNTLSQALAELDALFANVNEGRYVDLPTAVGFCMYIRRDCLLATGMFDEQRFGRGYGEENDFSRRALTQGWRNVLAADVFVYHAGGASFGAERAPLVKRAEETLAVMHPDYFDAVHAFVRNDPPAELRRAVELEMARVRCVSRYPEAFSAPSGTVHLHVVHDMGGGIERWCRDFCRADDTPHLVLKPFYNREMAVEGCMLMTGPDDPVPLGMWQFNESFQVTAVHHEGYAQALAEIVATFRIGAVLVSSVIGHALDALDTGLPTFWIGHDYFPLCPHIHVHYEAPCVGCDDTRLADCALHNHMFNVFPALSVDNRRAIRHAWLDLLERRAVTLVVPTRNMRQRIVTLFPGVAAANWVQIPHGVDDGAQGPYPVSADSAAEPLRILVLGQLSFCKGVRLLEALLGRMEDVAEFHLVGAQEMGELFLDRHGVRVVKSYSLDALPDIVAGIQPHLGLLLSVWPETYSYTLTELMRMGIPPVATRLGAFAERIIDGETGFLVEPQVEAIADRLRVLDRDRAALSHVRACLAGLPQRSVADMVADYRRLLPAATGRVPPANTKAAENVQGLRWAVQLTAQRKRIRSLELGMEMRAERIRRLQRAVQRVEEEAENARRELATLHDGLQDCERQLGMITMSRSWRLTAPLRWLRRRFGRAR